MMLALLTALALSQDCANYDAGCRVDELKVQPADYAQRGPNDFVGLTSYADAFGYRYGLLRLGGLSGIDAIYGGLNLENDHHRYVQVNYYGVFWPDNDDQWQLGYVNVAWAAFHSYRFTTKPKALTCADNGTAEPCTSTATPGATSMRFDCQDADGCLYAPGTDTVTLLAGSYATVDDGRQLCVMNVSAHPLTMRNGGTFQLAGDFTGGQWASLCLEWVSDRWVEKSRRNP